MSELNSEIKFSVLNYEWDHILQDIRYARLPSINSDENYALSYQIAHDSDVLSILIEKILIGSFTYNFYTFSSS